MSSEMRNGLTVRHRTDELMDQPGLDAAEHARALRGLRRINALSRSDSILWTPIARLARQSSSPIRVLDVACGGGDVTAALASRTRREKLDIVVDGCDVSSIAVEIASSRTDLCRIFQCDALRDPLPQGYDVICCSLFLHHLEPEDAVSILAKMASSANRLVLINDLSRSRFGYVLAWIGCRILSRSYVVHHDGPSSVAAAFTPAEALGLAGKAGLLGATVARRWPARFLLTWERR